MTGVIEHACRLVHEERLTNREIADQLGFSDEFHFSHRFKQVTGRSPAQFRTPPSPPLINARSIILSQLPFACEVGQHPKPLVWRQDWPKTRISAMCPWKNGW